MIVNLARALVGAGVRVSKPFKILAYRTRRSWLKRLIIEVTTFWDWVAHFVFGQNEAMQLYEKVYGGDFLFGHAVMVTDFETTDREIRLPSHRTSTFMGIGTVSSNGVFVVNAAMISLGEPFRGVLRRHIEENVFTDAIDALTYDDVVTKCRTALDEWTADPRAAEIVVMRSVATRMIVLLLENVLISKQDSEAVTAAYVKGFVQLSLFKRYFPFLSGVLGSEQRIKRDAFYRLRELGVSNPVIDATLFAAMFSIGTLFIRCVGDVRRHGIDYTSLDLEARRRFVIEAVRLYPTVTTTHRVAERDETRRVAGREIRVEVGDEIAYPFVCSNRDSSTFECPHELKLDRAESSYDEVLSWSKGAHACPARDLSVLVTVAMLDAMARVRPLEEIEYRGLV
jgi:hypothetical protein